MTKCNIFEIFGIFQLLSLKKRCVLCNIFAFMYDIYGVLIGNIPLKEHSLA